MNHPLVVWKSFMTQICDKPIAVLISTNLVYSLWTDSFTTVLH